LASIHKAGIVHRDLKLENVVYSLDKQWKIIDFGSSTTKKIPNISALQKHEFDKELAEFEMVTT